MTVSLGYLYHSVGRYPSGNADNERVNILPLEYREGTGYILLFVIIGNREAGQRVDTGTAQLSLGGRALADNDIDRRIDLAESEKSTFAHFQVPFRFHVFR